MGAFLDSVPVSAIIKIRDLMHTVKDPFRLDQGDVSFDAPDTVKQAMAKAIADNRTHYLPTTGVPRLRELLTEKMRTANGIPIGSADEVVPSNGGTHGIWAIMHALFEPGDEVIVSDPEWPATMAIAIAAKAKPVAVPLYEKLGWRWDLDELERAITPRTKLIVVTNLHNPSNAFAAAETLQQIGALAQRAGARVLVERSGCAHVPEQLDARRRRIDVLATRTPRARRARGQLPSRNGEPLVDDQRIVRD